MTSPRPLSAIIARAPRLRLVPLLLPLLLLAAKPIPDVVPDTVPLPGRVSKKKDKGLLPPPVEPLTTGDASGPFAAALSSDGRAHLAYTSRTGKTASLLYRFQGEGLGWEEDVVVIRGEPKAVALAAPATGPVVGVLAAGQVFLATRDGSGAFVTRSITDPGERPAAIAMTRTDSATHVLVALDGKPDAGAGAGQGPPRLLRVAILGDGREERTDHDVPQALGGTIVALHAEPAPGGGDHLLLVHRATTGRVLLLGSKGGEGTTTLLYTRLESALLPPVLLASSGQLGGVALATIDAAPALFWSARDDAGSTLFARRPTAGRLGSPEALAEDPEGITALAAAGHGDIAVVAAATGRSKRRMEVMWLTPVADAPFAGPPGSDRADWAETLGLVALLGPDQKARVFVQEKPQGDEAQTRIVCWIAPARTGLLER